MHEGSFTSQMCCLPWRPPVAAAHPILMSHILLGPQCSFAIVLQVPPAADRWCTAGRGLAHRRQHWYSLEHKRSPPSSAVSPRSGLSKKLVSSDAEALLTRRR